MSAEADLLAFVLRHGDVTLRALRASAGTAAAARDLEWLMKVNGPDWTHRLHSDDCMSDPAEQRRELMTAGTVEANHRLHMAHVQRIEAALRGGRR